MRTRQTMTISLPPAMIRAVEKARKEEQRTRSELIREALRTYFAAKATYTPTIAELRLIEKRRAALRRGEYRTVDELRADIGREGRKSRSKKRSARASH